MRIKGTAGTTTHGDSNMFLNLHRIIQITYQNWIGTFYRKKFRLRLYE